MKKLFIILLFISGYASGQLPIMPLKQTGNTISEKKIYFRGEWVKDSTINSSGAVVADADSYISDYLPITPSESVTISTANGSNMTVYGWTYTSALVPISEIRAVGSIGTELSTYTFTTPSNAAYINIIVKYNGGDDERELIRIESTNAITYNSPIRPEFFAGTTSQKIQAALDFQRFTTSHVELTGYYALDATLIMSSGNTLVLNNARVQLASGTHDNLIRNEAVANPSTHIFTRGNRHIKIIGQGNAMFQGSTENWGGDDPDGSPGGEDWRSQGIRFANVANLEISGFTMKATNANPLDLEQCRFGSVDNIHFEQGLEHLNQGGVEIIRGSHDIVVSNIRGTCQDDIAVMGNILGNERLHILGSKVYDQDRSDLDMFNIHFRNIIRDKAVHFGDYPEPLYGNAIRLLTSDGLKLHSSSIDGVTGYENIFIGSPFDGYELADPAVLGDVYNISVSNTGNAPVYIYKPLKNSSFINVAKYDTSGGFQAVVPPTTSVNITRMYYGSAMEFCEDVGTTDWLTFGGVTGGGSSMPVKFYSNFSGSGAVTAQIGSIASQTGLTMASGEITGSGGNVYWSSDNFGKTETTLGALGSGDRAVIIVHRYVSSTQFILYKVAQLSGVWSASIELHDPDLSGGSDEVLSETISAPSVGTTFTAETREDLLIIRVGAQTFSIANTADFATNPSSAIALDGNIALDKLIHYTGESGATGGGSAVFSLSGSDAYYTAGKVGIGTSSPLANLTVQDATADDNYVAYFGSGSVANDNAKVSRIALRGLATNNVSVGTIISGHETSGSSPASYIALGNRNAAGTVAERFRVASTGALKLNSYGSGSITGTPAYTLGVDASGNVIETSGGSSDWTGATGSTIYRASNVGVNTGGAPLIPLDIRKGSSSFAQFGVAGSTNYATLFAEDTYNPALYWHPSTDMRFGTGGTGLYSTSSFDVIMTLKSGGVVQMNTYGAGTATFDASGNISSSSDIRLKNVQGRYTAGLAAIMKLHPITYKWNEKSHLETKNIYAGFSAQNVKASIPYGTGEAPDGMLSLQDRAIMAALVNAVKELNAKVEKLEAELKAKK